MSGEYEQALNYLKKIQNQVVHNKIERWTDILALDFLLNRKKEEAEKKNIKIEIMSRLGKFNIVEEDAVALFGNAIDNAIESCERLEGGTKWIKISIQSIKDMNFIKITNPCNVPPVILKDSIVSIKDNKMMHGW